MTAPGSTTCFSGFNLVTNTRADLSRRLSSRSDLRHASSIIYPEFSHRLPPPSYQAAMNEQRLNLFVMESRSRMRISPPPAYNTENRSSSGIFNWKNDVLPS